MQREVSDDLLKEIDQLVSKAKKNQVAAAGGQKVAEAVAGNGDSVGGLDGALDMFK